MCDHYRRLVYAKIRRFGMSREESEDLTQEFFYWFISKEKLSQFVGGEGELGRFVNLLLKHFLIKQWRRASAQKRGGGMQPIGLDEAIASGREAEFSELGSPGKLAEMRHVREKMDEVVRRLRDEFESEGGGDRFAALSAYLAPSGSVEPVAVLAGRLAISPGALRVAVLRLRRRYRRLLLAALMEDDMTESPGDYVAYLLGLFSR